ncbi:MAG TPA: hypothetical protein PKX20_07195 [Methanothrix soehngenii]|jgi:hypothetical protein|nr:hypothetical protein [Methanothrix soehngenii]
MASVLRVRSDIIDAIIIQGYAGITIRAATAAPERNYAGHGLGLPAVAFLAFKEPSIEEEGYPVDPPATAPALADISHASAHRQEVAEPESRDT